MILDVLRCSQLFTDVFSWVVTFMDKPGCPPISTSETLQVYVGKQASMHHSSHQKARNLICHLCVDPFYSTTVMAQNIITETIYTPPGNTSSPTLVPLILHYVFLYCFSDFVAVQERQKGCRLLVSHWGPHPLTDRYNPTLGFGPTMFFVSIIFICHTTFS